MTASPRRLYPVDADVPSAPRFDPGLPLRANAATLAQWLWGERRARWCAELADDVGRARPLARYAPASREWAAAVLCAAAVDSGRGRRASTWSRTVSSIAVATELPREAVLARWTELAAIGLTRPSGTGMEWRKDGLTGVTFGG